MACLRLFTRPPLPPLPDFSVPLFLRRIALATRLPAALPYLLRLLRCGIVLSRNSDANPVERVVFWDLDVGATVPARALEYRKPSNPCRSKRPLCREEARSFCGEWKTGQCLKSESPV